MAFSTSTRTVNNTEIPNNLPPDVITIAHEKEFAVREFFSNNIEKFNKHNPYVKIYDEGNEASIPLTSVVYTPNKMFFERSKFYRQFDANKCMAFLKKNNIYVIVYGQTSVLDTINTGPFTESSIPETIDLDCFSSSRTCISSIFQDEMEFNTYTNDEFVNMIRFENSPFNQRIVSINERIKNLYSCNFTNINYLVFNDLNNDKCVKKFLKNIINVSLI